MCSEGTRGLELSRASWRGRGTGLTTVLFPDGGRHVGDQRVPGDAGGQSAVS